MLLVCLPLLALAGCGKHATATPPPTAIKHAATRTPTPATPTPTVLAVVATPVPPTVTSTAVPATATAPPSATPTPTPPAAAPGVIAASLRPASVGPGGTLSATVNTRGPVGRVQMYLGSGAPNSPSPVVLSLSEGPTATWTGSVVAPSAAGMYHFTVGLFSGGRRTVVDNDSWNIQVVGAPTSQPAPEPAAAALPGDIPLVPPFSYLNPVVAVFNAGGSVVHGSEVSSNLRTDVSAAAIADFYQSHLPRAGWSVEDSGTPPGGNSFTIVATKSDAAGTRVCIVQYSGGIVHIFYGTE